MSLLKSNQVNIVNAFKQLQVISQLSPILQHKKNAPSGAFYTLNLLF